VVVTFKEPVGDRFVGVLNLVMGTETLARPNATHYTFRIGHRGSQNDYAVFFSALPYVHAVSPLPRLSAAEKGELPNVVIGPGGTASRAQGRPAASGSRGYLPGQLLVKPRANVAPQALAAFNALQGATLKNTLDGIDVQVLQLPAGLSVEEAQQRYQASGLVQFAEPNRTYTLQNPLPSDPVPADNGGAGIYLSPNQLIGAHVLVRYRAGGPVPDLINLVYGTKTLEESEVDQARLSLPPHVSPLLAERILRLCPYVAEAEPAYGR
jgi:hypothetical protein